MEPPQSLINKLNNYQPNPKVAELVNRVPTLLLVGISGAGKDTVKQLLLKSKDYHHIVSHTTRPPRKNQGVLEQDGVDYHFIDYKTAEHMLDNYGYVEAKRYGNNIYGTSVGEFQLAHDEQKIAITDLEVQGVAEYMRLAPDGVRPVFLLPPSYEEWQRRVAERYGDDRQGHSEDIKLREQTAKKELEHLLTTDYFYAVINENLETTTVTINAIAQGANTRAIEKTRALSLAENILTHL